MFSHRPSAARHRRVVQRDEKSGCNALELFGAILQKPGETRRIGTRTTGLPRFTNNKEINMNMTITLGPLVSLIAGILILVVPRMLNYIVAIYLIVIGLIGLFGGGNFHIR